MSTELIQRPTNDWIFKRIFGDENNIEHLRGFLSALLGFSESELSEIVIQNPFTAQMAPDEKFGILDVSIKTTAGKQVNLEVQVSPQSDLGDRLAFYVSSLAARQKIKGRPYSEMAQSISVCILDHVVNSDVDDYHLVYHLRDKKYSKCLSAKIEVHTLELPKLPERDVDPLWSWLSYFKSRTEEDLEIAATHCKEVEQVVSTFKKLTADELEMQRLYDYEKKQNDIASERWHAVEAGKAEGRAEGKAEGMSEAVRETAKKMLAAGLDREQISEFTDLTLEEVNQLAETLSN